MKNSNLPNEVVDEVESRTNYLSTSRSIFSPHVLHSTDFEKGENSSSDFGSPIYDFKPDHSRIGLLQDIHNVLKYHRASHHQEAIEFYKNGYSHGCFCPLKGSEESTAQINQPANTEQGFDNFVDQIIIRAKNRENGDSAKPPILLMGERGSGKSTLVNKVLVSEQPKLKQNNVVFIRFSMVKIPNNLDVFKAIYAKAVYIFVKKHCKFTSSIESTPKGCWNYYEFESFLKDKYQGAEQHKKISEICSEIKDILNYETNPLHALEEEVDPDFFDPEFKIESDDITSKIKIISVLYKELLDFFSSNFCKNRLSVSICIDGLDPLYKDDLHRRYFEGWLNRLSKWKDHIVDRTIQLIFVVRADTHEWSINLDSYKSLLNGHYERNVTDPDTFIISNQCIKSILKYRIANSKERSSYTNAELNYLFCLCIQYFSIALDEPYQNVLENYLGYCQNNVRRALGVLEEICGIVYRILLDLTGVNQTGNDSRESDIVVINKIRDLMGNNLNVDYKSWSPCIRELPLNKYAHDGKENEIHKRVIRKFQSQSYRLFHKLVCGDNQFQIEPFYYEPIKGKISKLEEVKLVANNQHSNFSKYGSLCNIYSFPKEIFAISESAFPELVEYEHYEQSNLFARIIILHILYAATNQDKECRTEIANLIRHKRISNKITYATLRYFEFYGLILIKKENSTIESIELLPFGKYIYEKMFDSSEYFSQCLNTIYIPREALEDGSFKTFKGFWMIYHSYGLSSSDKLIRKKILAKHAYNRLIFINLYISLYRKSITNEQNDLPLEYLEADGRINELEHWEKALELKLESLRKNVESAAKAQILSSYKFKIRDLYDAFKHEFGLKSS